MGFDNRINRYKHFPTVVTGKMFFECKSFITFSLTHTMCTLHYHIHIYLLSLAVSAVLITITSRNID